MTMASGLYIPTHRDAMNDGTPLTLDYTNASNIVCLYLDAKTPNFDTDAAYSATDEVDDAAPGYDRATKTVGGSPTFAIGSSGYLKYAWTVAISWASATFTARGIIVHTVTATKYPLVAVTFGQDYTATNGTFTVTQNAAGIFTIKLNPNAA